MWKVSSLSRRTCVIHWMYGKINGFYQKIWENYTTHNNNNNHRNVRNDTGKHRFLYKGKRHATSCHGESWSMFFSQSLFATSVCIHVCFFCILFRTQIAAIFVTRFLSFCLSFVSRCDLFRFHFIVRVYLMLPHVTFYCNSICKRFLLFPSIFVFPLPRCYK